MSDHREAYERAREEYRRYIFSGYCPCCSPDWEYPEISMADVWDWQDEFDAWKVYEEIMNQGGFE